MQALQKVRPAAGLEFRSCAEPVPEAGEVLVKVHSAAICGTDIHIAEWTPGYESMEKAMPVTLGHEFSGTVMTTGPGVDPALVGKQITARPSTTCGQCRFCLSGDEDNCTGRKGVGIGRNGAFAEFVCVPAKNCHVLPDSLDLAIAALTEPMTVCAEAVATAEVSAGQKVLVVGPGFIGQGIAILARAKGAEVVVLGRQDGPRLSALRAAGFEHLIDTADTPMGEALAEHGAFDAVIEAAGVPALINPCLQVLKKRGILAVVGIHPRPAEVDLTRLVRMHQQIRGSYRAPARTWDEIIDFLDQNQGLMGGLISHHLPLAEAMDGFALSKQRIASKVVLKIGDDR
ncbi:zinc-dependent alcohol dehydrogenase [Roseibium suaedae]|uniref:L-iditol 2-dehydrogenase/threonine 3-dehydrogenase n=1 Tax=Roseibium suaedae TaxID=735517 RepID=A0A1M7BGS5_9HYPH|nr:alcohol dehydrogenase catalytic domain-containing protein [Roseibium suaedae]SHL54225.1 L-iditol 2-dehydrogenase/threonine 3-dehydrogenase [Roseibium suaedae]